MQDHKLRIFSRNSDPAHVEAMKQAFETWITKRFDGLVKAATPCKGAPANGLSNGRKRMRQELHAVPEFPPLVL